MSQDSRIIQPLRKTGQVASYAEFEKLVFAFEAVLRRFGIPIQSGSELEAACFSVLDVLGKNQNPHICNPQEDIRLVFTDILGIWAFLAKIVRLESHACFPQFVPHLALLNKGTVGQNKRAVVCQEETNKIFELLFALVLLDVSEEVLLDDPNRAKGNNPDVLAKIDTQCWGFACKTIYGKSGKTFYDNLKKGVEQIEAAPKAQVGIVVMNLRNIISHDACWPILNEAQYRNGEEPVFSAYERPAEFVTQHILEIIKEKNSQVVAEIGLLDVMKMFDGKKALPAYFTFCQACTGRVSAVGPIPTLITRLDVGHFGNVQAHQSVFDKINLALHNRLN